MGVINAYTKIEEAGKVYGSLKKGEFHIHTPASYDYKLRSGRFYKDLSIEEVLEFAVEESYITTELREKMLQDIEYYKSENYTLWLKEKRYPLIT